MRSRRTLAGLVVRVLRNELAGESLGEDGLTEAEGYTLGDTELHLIAGLNRPSSGNQQPIDFGAGFLFRGHQYVGK